MKFNDIFSWIIQKMESYVFLSQIGDWKMSHIQWILPNPQILIWIACFQRISSNWTQSKLTLSICKVLTRQAQRHGLPMWPHRSSGKQLFVTSTITHSSAEEWRIPSLHWWADMYQWDSWKFSIEISVPSADLQH